MAYALAEGGTRAPVKKVRKPNLAARVDMMYHVDDDGAWRANGHEMVPMDASATPRLCCRLCNSTALWAHKAFLFQKACRGVAKQKPRRQVLETAPAHIVKVGVG
eukprot:5111887-Amphidinium_carterae.1